MPKVFVPQEGGDIRIAVAGDDPTIYKVSAGTVNVPAEDLDVFLGAVEGSSIEAKPASTSSKEK